jgi:hypothetical protein
LAVACFEVVKTEERPEFFTLEGLAASFGVSTGLIRKYIENGHVDPALSRRHDGFNYDMTHFKQIERIRARRAKYTISQRQPRAHVVVVARGAAA